MTLSRVSAILVATLFSISSASAQLVTTTGISAQSLVQNTLLGGGVTAFNITFTGVPTAIGHFDGSQCNVGLNEGIIITTGTARDSIDPFGDQLGPFGPNNSGSAGFDNFAPGDPDLALITGIQSFNAGVLEFDFVPTGDTVRFNYVFASDEYLEFVGGGINDAFAFWISGPGIPTPTNIALIPGTATPVTIDNVNNVTNAAYYIDNGDGVTAPQNTSATYIQYDGMTTVLTAEAVVTPCDTFHLKIAISDMSDGIYDSGVFLEARSLSSNNLIVDADIDFGSNDSTLYEGCGDASLYISRPNNFANVDTVFFVMGGSATNGTDYNAVQDTMYFQVGQDSIIINISALQDGLLEGIESVTMMAITHSACSSDTAFIQLYIADVPPLFVTTSNDTNLVCGDSVPIWGSASGGFGVSSYSWNGGVAPGDTSAWVSPGVTTTYILTVVDTCNGQIATDSVTVTVPSYPPVITTAGNNLTLYCPGLSAPLFVNSIGGAGHYTYVWDNNLGPDSIHSVTPAQTTIYVVTATDLCGVTATDTVTITLDYVPLHVTASNDTVICTGDSTFLTSLASDGIPGYTYTWTNGWLTAEQWVTPTLYEQFIVTATDNCGETATDTVVVVSTAPTAAFSHSANVYEQNYAISFYDASTGDIATWEWDLGNEVTATTQNTSTPYEDNGDYTIMLAVMDENGCADTAWQAIHIFPEFQFYAPNAITPNGDLINDVFFGKGVGIQSSRLRIWDRWGNLVRETKELGGTWDGTYLNNKVAVEVFVYEFFLVAFTGQEHTFRGHVTVVR